MGDTKRYASSWLYSAWGRAIHARGGRILSKQPTLRYVMDMRPEIRSQIDICLAARESMQPVRTRLYEQFFGQFRTYKEFEGAFDAATNNYGLMVSHTTNASTSLSDSVFWYRAPWPQPSFGMGKDFVFELQRRFGHDEDEELEVPAGGAAVEMVDEDGGTVVQPPPAK